VAFGAGARKPLGPGGDSCCWPRSSPSLATVRCPDGLPSQGNPRLLVLRSQKQQDPDPFPPQSQLGMGRARAKPRIPTSPVRAEQALRMDERTDGRARTREEDRPHQGRRGTGTEGPSSHMQASRLLKRRAEAALNRQVRPVASQGLISIYANEPSAPPPGPPPR
jgi:hypothetical protein